MFPNEPLIRNVSDTARWVAFHRAQETARPDALFRDPLAEKLAGERGRAIAEKMSSRDTWPFTIRTVEFDAAIQRAIAAGADGVINLAAGFDTRPYRLNLPPSLRWFELDLPELLEEKKRLLEGEKPRCEVQRLAVDLTDTTARRDALKTIANSLKNAIVLSEGLLVYLSDSDVAQLSDDLSAFLSLPRMGHRSYEPNLAENGEAPIRESKLSGRGTDFRTRDRSELLQSARLASGIRALAVESRRRAEARQFPDAPVRSLPRRSRPANRPAVGRGVCAKECQDVVGGAFQRR